MDKISLTQKYFCISSSCLIKSEIIIFFQISIEGILTLLHFRDILQKDSEEKIFSKLYANKNSSLSTYFLIITLIIHFLFILYHILLYYKNSKIINKIAINIYEYLHLRVLQIFYINFIVNSDISMILKFILLLLQSTEAIYHFINYHLFYYIPQIIMNNYPFDYFSLSIDLAQYFIKICIGLIGLNYQLKNYFIICIIIGSFFFSVYLLYIMIYKSFYLMNNEIINKYRIGLFLSTTILYFINLHIKLFEVLLVFINVNILSAICWIIFYVYDPYKNIHFSNDKNFNFIIKIFYFFRGFNIKKIKDNDHNDNNSNDNNSKKDENYHSNKNLIINPKYDFSFSIKTLLSNKKNTKENIKQDDLSQISQIDYFVFIIELQKQIQNGYFNLNNLSSNSKKNYSANNNDINNNNNKKSDSNCEKKSAIWIKYNLIILYQKYKKTDSILSMNLLAMYYILFNFNFSYQKVLTFSKFNRDMFTNTISRMLEISLHNEFLQFLKEIIIKLKIFLNNPYINFYEDYINFSKLLHTLKGKTFSYITKTQRPNSKLYTDIISKYIYEELLNTSINQYGFHIRDTVSQYEEFLTNHYNNYNEIVMFIDICNFDNKVVFTGKDIKYLLNNDIKLFFPLDMKNLQSNIFKDKIIDYEINNSMNNYYSNNNSVINNNNNNNNNEHFEENNLLKLVIYTQDKNYICLLLIRFNLFCHQFNVILYGKYQIIYNTLITKKSSIYNNFQDEYITYVSNKKLSITLGIKYNDFKNWNEEVIASDQKIYEMTDKEDKYNTIYTVYQLENGRRSSIKLLRIPSQKSKKSFFSRRDINASNFSNNYFANNNKNSNKNNNILNSNFNNNTANTNDNNNNDMKGVNFMPSERMSVSMSMSASSNYSNKNYSTMKKKSKLNDKLKKKNEYRNILIILFLAAISIFIIWMILNKKKKENYIHSFDIYMLFTETFRLYYQIIPSIVFIKCLIKDKNKPCINYIDEYNKRYNENNKKNFPEKFSEKNDINFTEILAEDNILKITEFEKDLDNLITEVYDYNDPDTNLIFNGEIDSLDLYLENETLHVNKRRQSFVNHIGSLKSAFNYLVNDKDNKNNNSVYMIKLAEHNFDMIDINDITLGLINFYNIIINHNTIATFGCDFQIVFNDASLKRLDEYQKLQNIFLYILLCLDVIIFIIIRLHLYMYDAAILSIINEIRFKCFIQDSVNKNLFKQMDNFDKQRVVCFTSTLLAKINAIENMAKLYEQPIINLMNDIDKCYNEYSVSKKIIFKYKQQEDNFKNGDNDNNTSTYSLKKIKYHNENSYTISNEIEKFNQTNSSLKNILFKTPPKDTKIKIIYGLFIIFLIEFIIFLAVYKNFFNTVKAVFKVINDTNYCDVFLNLGLEILQFMIYGNGTLPEINTWLYINRTINIRLAEYAFVDIRQEKSVDKLKSIIKEPDDYLKFNCNTFYKDTKIDRILQISNERYHDNFVNYCEAYKLLNFESISYLYSYHFSLFNRVILGLSLVKQSNLDDYVINGDYCYFYLTHFFVYIPVREFVDNNVFNDWMSLLKVEINYYFIICILVLAISNVILIVVFFVVFSHFLEKQYLMILDMRGVFEIEKNNF